MVRVLVFVCSAVSRCPSPDPRGARRERERERGERLRDWSDWGRKELEPPFLEQTSREKISPIFYPLFFVFGCFFVSFFFCFFSNAIVTHD